jgi:threonylcarbamoyladenosine tRNA methylthiotransferase MtaB
MSTEFRKVAFHTLGCKLNFAESSMLKKSMIENGYQSVKFNDGADVFVINTCTVTENADRECRKIIRRAKRKSPNSVIAVIGCYAQLNSKLISEIPGVNLVLGAEEKFNLLHHINQLHPESPVSIFNNEIKHVKEFYPSFSSGERTRAFLKVQDGCDYSCTFCTIPLARGISRNQSIAKTLQVAQQIADSEYREIVLTGVNIGDFGKSTNEKFIDLLTELDELDGIDRIRISSIEPNLLTNEIIEFVAISNKIMPHFHIPLQSGSDKILSLMKRRYKRKIFKERLNKINSIIPNCGIGVDVIVGFPGETEEDFLETYHYLSELKISYLHVFTYSERPDTDAINMIGIVSREDRANRSKMLHVLSEKKKESFYLSQKNSIKEVLFESEINNQISGWTKNYIRFSGLGSKELENKILNVYLKSFKNGMMRGHIAN